MLHTEAVANSYYNKNKKVFNDAVEATQAISALTVRNCYNIIAITLKKIIFRTPTRTQNEDHIHRSNDIIYTILYNMY